MTTTPNWGAGQVKLHDVNVACVLVIISLELGTWIGWGGSYTIDDTMKK
jgi:hypothetical protein